MYVDVLTGQCVAHPPIGVAVAHHRLHDMTLDHGQAFVIFTTLIGWGKQNPTRSVLRMAVESLEKYTEESETTVAGCLNTNSECCCGTAQMVSAATLGLTSSGTPAMTRVPGFNGTFDPAAA